MSTEELKEYLGIVVDMEENIFLQTQIISTLKTEINLLGKEKIIAKPIKPSEPKPESKNVKRLSFRDIWETIIGIVAMILSFVFLIGFIVTPILIIMSISEARSSKKKWEAKWSAYKESLNRYNQDLIEYEHTVKLDKIRVESELNKKVFLTQELNELNLINKNTQAILNRIYEKNIIFSKYRNLAMVCSLYEYIRAGRCTELEGHEGAYNILETEIRLDRIILQLDKVVAQLEQIKHTQFMLYSAVQESNQRLCQIMGSISDMSASLDSIYSSASQLNENAVQLNARIAELQKSSALTAYHAERAQKELAYMNRMDYLSGRNDNVFWNHPPV